MSPTVNRLVEEATKMKRVDAQQYLAFVKALEAYADEQLRAMLASEPADLQSMQGRSRALAELVSKLQV